ncbi:MAG: hypothetical protein V1936_04850 [Patescibacteria group bacterium]
MSYGTPNLEHPRLTRPLTESRQDPEARRNPEAEKSVGKQLEALKEEVESTKRAQEFVVKNSLDLEIETRIGALSAAPDFPFRKNIYERMMFGQKCILKNNLVAGLRKAIEKNRKIDDAELEKIARETIENWLGELKKLDRNGDKKITYTELIPKTKEAKEFIERVFVTNEFFVEMENSPLFQGEPKVDENVPKKSAFVKDYVSRFAKSLIRVGKDGQTVEAVPGSGLQLGQLLQSISLSVVGGKFLTNKDFGKAWEELKTQDANVAKVFAEGEKQNAQEKFEKMLEKTSEQIRAMRMGADADQRKLLQLEASNPHGFTLRKFGDMTSIIMYYGSNLLFATIGVNAVLSGFNPEAMLKNPVMWAMAAGILAAKKHLNPEFMSGTPPIQKVEQNELKERFAKAAPAVQEWLTKFSKGDLGPKEKIGKLLAEEGRYEINSAEIENFVKPENRPASKVLANSSEARELFLFFQACQQRDFNPKKLADA